MTPSVIPNPTEPKLISAVSRIESPKKLRDGGEIRRRGEHADAVAKFQPRRGVRDEIEVSPPETRDGGRKLLWQVQIADPFADAVAAGNKHAAVVEDVPVAFDLDFGGIAEQMVCALERRSMANHGQIASSANRESAVASVVSPLCWIRLTTKPRSSCRGKISARRWPVTRGFCTTKSRTSIRLPASVAAGLMRNRLR